jgi:transposase
LLPTVFARGNVKTIKNLEKLRNRALSEKAPRVALRIQGILMSLERRSANEIARCLHVHRSTVHSWILAWNEHRENGLLEGHRSGRRSKLSAEDKERLGDIIESGPVAYGLNTGVWSSPIIAQLIKDEFDVSYHPGHVRKLLKCLGFSVQRPTTKLVQADPQKQNRWVRYTYPNLKKKHVKKTP